MVISTYTISERMMAKIRYYKIPSKERDKMLKALAKIPVSCKSEPDAQKLLSYVLTKSEIVMLTRRIQIASLLVQGKSQWEIREQLGAGFSTIRSVEQWLGETFVNYSGIRYAIKGRKPKRGRKIYTTPIEDWRVHPAQIGLKRADPYFAIFQLLILGMERFLEKKKPDLETRLYKK